MSDYFLTTDRLGFAHWQADDAPLAERLWGDEAVARFIRATPYTADQAAQRLRDEIDSQAQSGVAYWPIYTRDGSDFVGCCGLHPHDGSLGEFAYELGYHLLPAYWGQGLATEAAGAVLRYAVDVLHAPTVLAGHHPDNAPSGKVLTKLGFVRIGEGFFPPTGLMHPIYRYDASR